MSGSGAPVLRVVRGEPTREELAAVVALLVARASAAPPPAPPAARSRWAVPVLRGPVVPGPDAWRASAFPSR